ncbi:MAG TPA: pitrilysin family protein [Pyrinomonadaceae bacterium]|nr:pitrilysin family protein [Pyrinomonadaceae bacterium]
MNLRNNFSVSVRAYFLILTLALSFIAPASAQTKQTPQAVTKPAAVSAQNTEVPFVNRVLANGLEVIVLPDSSVPLVTVELAVRNGSFTEPPELNGLSHLYEHMFFKTNGAIMLYRCQQYENYGNIQAYRQNQCGEHLRYKNEIGSADYLTEIGKLGITYNGTTREEVVNYYFTTTSPFWQTAMRFIKDSVRYPVFEENEFEREKQVVIGEIDRQESSPFFYLNRAINDKLFYKYPTRKNPGGTRETVSSATTSKMRTIQSRYYVPNNSAIVVTGDVAPDRVFAEAERLFGDWKPRAVEPFKEFPLVEHPPLAKSEGEIIQQPVENVFLMIGWHGPSIGKDDAATYAADVFSYILGQPNSRFQRNIVDKTLASSVGIGYYTQRNVGPIMVSAITTPDKARAAAKAIYEEIAAFNSPGYFTDEELESAKSILASRDLFEREQTSEYAHTLSFWWSSTGIDYFRGYQKNLRATSRADINRYVTNYIQNKPHIGLALMSADAQSQAKLTPEELIGK